MINTPPANSPVTLCMISGNGRSGSNRLLDLLDFSDITACRNEPDEVDGSWLCDFGYQLFDEGLRQDEVKALYQVLKASADRRSNRDRFNRPEKQFLTPVGKALLPFMARAKIRRVAHALRLMRSPLEWRLPSAAVNGTPSLPVVKLNARPIWAEQIAKIEPGLRIVHNIRQPWPYLNSWYNRFVANQRAISQSFEEHFSDVPFILSYFDRNDSDRLRESSLANIVEVELWRWRYINERIMKLDIDDGRYLRLTYEEIDANPLAASLRLYEFLDLSVPAQLDENVVSLKNTLFATPNKSGLDAQLVERAIKDVLHDSTLKQVFKDGFLLP